MSHNIPCSWQVKFTKTEIRHQLEPGDEHPYHTRQGRIIDFVPYPVQNRNGPDDTVMMCVVRQERDPKLLVLPLTTLAVLDDPQYA